MIEKPEIDTFTAGLSRRAFVAGTAAIAGGLWSSVGARVAHAAAGGAVKQLDTLSTRTFAKNVNMHARHFPELACSGKMQMMAVGERRYLFQMAFGGNWINPSAALARVIDVSDPLRPAVVASGVGAYNIQVAFRPSTGRWMLMTSHEVGSLRKPHEAAGLRGVSFYDVTDPLKPVLLSRYATDGGDPQRAIQEGSGCHRCYWDGGRYAYLTTAPNYDFYSADHDNVWSLFRQSLLILDVADVSRPKAVSKWWVPGQRNDEEAARRAWRSHADRAAYDGLHGPVYVPQPIERGGRYGYGGWGTHGVLIHDFSDPSAPSLVGRWQEPQYIAGPMIPNHTVDVTRLGRGFVIANPESIAPDCQEPWHDSWVIDVSNPRKPRTLAQLPRPVPPPDAPFTDFCQLRGRFGPHNAPHLKAPGRPHPSFTAYAFFNGGLQCYDLSDPAKPTISGYFIPPQAGDLADARTVERAADDVFIEWDRKLIWLGANSGLYVLSSPALGEPVLAAMAVKEWSLPGLNGGPEWT